MNGCIHLDPLKRLTLPQILAHEWLKETNDDSENDSDEEEKDKNEENKDTKDKSKDDKDSKTQGEKDDDIDLKAISGNINFVNVDNLFYQENYNTKLSYTDY